MIKRIILNIMLSVPLVFCFGQDEDRIENQIMECVYEYYSYEDIDLRELILNYQKLLIKERILENGSGESYRAIWQRVANGTFYDKKPSQFFWVEIKKLGIVNINFLQECRNITITGSILYKNSKLKEFEEVGFSSFNSENDEFSSFTKGVTNKISKQDFELDFYKLKTFLLYNIIDTESGLRNQATDKSEVDITNTFRIIIDSKNEVYVKNKKVNLRELKKLINLYLRTYKSESISSFKINKEVKYPIYISVQKAVIAEIYYLREKLARDKFNSDYKELTNEQIGEVNKIYPKRVLE